MISPVSQATPGKVGIRKGDVLEGKVIDRIGSFQYRIRILGQETTVNSRIPLRQGQRLILKIENFLPRLKLKLITAQFPTSQKISQYTTLLQELGLKGDGLSVAILEHFLKLKIPLRQKEIKSIRKAVGQLELFVNEDAATLLMPFGIWYHVMPQAFWEDPQFLFRWMWKGYKNKKDDQKASDASEEETEEISQLLLDVHQELTTHERLQTWLQIGVQSLLEFNTNSEKNTPLLAENRFKFYFLQKQIKRFQFGQWAMLPFRWKNQENFFYIRQLNKHPLMNILIEFTIPGREQKPTEVRAHINETSLRVEFWNDDQAYRQKVDNSFTLFLKEIRKITNFKKVELIENPQLRCFQGLKDYFKEIQLKASGAIDGPPTSSQKS